MALDHGRPRPAARHQQHLRPSRRRRGAGRDRADLPRAAARVRRSGAVRRRGVRDPVPGDDGRRGARDRRADPARRRGGEFEVETSSEPIRATVSIGVAAFPRDGVDANELIHQADLAVYRAKLQGRNRVLDASDEPLLARADRPGAARAAARGPSRTAPLRLGHGRAGPSRRERRRATRRHAMPGRALLGPARASASSSPPLRRRDRRSASSASSTATRPTSSASSRSSSSSARPGARAREGADRVHLRQRCRRARGRGDRRARARRSRSRSRWRSSSGARGKSVLHQVALQRRRAHARVADRGELFSLDSAARLRARARDRGWASSPGSRTTP